MIPPETIARCTRFVSGHGVMRPRAALAEIVDAIDDDEIADMYGAGATIGAFEAELAELLGKEAAVFMPSGTVAQLIAVRVWAERARRPVIAWHPTCHLEIHEQAAYSALHGLRSRLVGDRNRLITLADLEGIAEPVAALLLELPQREIGGQLPEWDDLVAQTEWARGRGLARHLDGARLWEAAPHYGRTPGEVAALFDTVYVSMYKAPGGIAGAALAGPADVMAEARVWLRRHGANLIHLFPYVLSARLNLRKRLPRMAGYRDRAISLAAALTALPGVRVLPDPPQTRMFHLYLPGDRDQLIAGSAAIAERDGVLLFRNLRTTDMPGYHVAELSVGDATEALTDAEIAGLFGQVLAGVPEPAPALGD